MSIPELIGFLLAMAALLFSFIRRVLEVRRQAADPEGYRRELQRQQQEQEQAYREMLDSLGIKLPEEPPEPKRETQIASKKKELRPLKAQIEDRKKTSRRNVTKDFEFHSNLEDRRIGSRIEQRRIETDVGQRFGKTYGQQLVAQDLRGVQKATSRTKNRETKIHRLVDRLPSKRDLVIYREVLGPPRGIAPWDGKHF